MPAVNLSPIFNAWQFFTNAGTPNGGGLINTYLAGSATPALTYIDSSGNTANSNPIVLDAAGFLPAELWLLNATAYKFVVTDSTGSNARTYDNITAPLAATASGANFTTTSNSVGFVAKLTAIGGVTGFEIQNQTAARVMDLLYWGASSSPLYGMTAGWAGINTPASVGFTIGTGDAVRMAVDPTSGYAGFGLAPTAAQGQVQLLGSATGGIKLGNVNNTYGNALDWYEEGSFTPAVTFGGTGTGATYSANTLGRFTRIGNRVFFNLRMLLTSKGSSTGTAKVTGLPYLADGTPGSAEQICSMDFAALAGLTGAPYGVILDAQQAITLFQTAAATSSTLADTNFTNTSDLSISGQYKV